MKKVIVIGCGFGGLAAVGQLAGFKKEVEVTVIDKGRFFNFLPMLPDVLGRNIAAEFLVYPIEELSRKFRFRFINAQVTSLDLQNNLAVTSNGDFSYDYLIIASGTETNFYGNEQIKRYASKLDDAEDAKEILKKITENDFNTYIVGGAGYTGIEVATNLRMYLNRVSRQRKIVIVERAPAILGPLPEWMKKSVAENLKTLNIDAFTNNAVVQIEEKNIKLSNSDTFDNAMLIWTAGVRTPDFVQGLNFEKNPQGRLKVDEYLRAAPNVFAIGDSAYFAHKGSFLRMAVHFALTQGVCAADNIARNIRRDKLKEYQPRDLGYIIPMANNHSCGSIFGVNLQGMVPTLMHYMMCIYRSRGYVNKLGIIKNLLTKPTATVMIF